MIQVTRDKQERLFVAGILAGTGADDLDTQNWLLSQNDLELSNVTLLWKDFSKSKADVADLRLENLTLQSGIRAHELKLDLFLHGTKESSVLRENLYIVSVVKPEIGVIGLVILNGMSSPSILAN